MEYASFGWILVSNITKVHYEPISLNLWLDGSIMGIIFVISQIKLWSPFFWFVHNDFMVQDGKWPPI